MGLTLAERDVLEGTDERVRDGAEPTLHLISRQARNDEVVPRARQRHVQQSPSFSVLLQGLRIGTRFPISTPEKGVTYMDVGLKISGRVNEREDGEVALDSNVEMTSFATSEQPEKRPGSPVLYNVEQGFSTRLASGKPTLLEVYSDF